jgi:hypothetical protein
MFSSSASRSIARAHEKTGGAPAGAARAAGAAPATGPVISGSVAPAKPGARIRVERRAGRRWSTQVSRLVRVRDGAFGLRVRLRTPGAYRVTAIAGKTRRRRTLRVR